MRLSEQTLNQGPDRTAVTGEEGSLSPERRAFVERARDAWVQQLIDLSRRNNLLYFRDLKTGTLDLSAAGGDALTALLQGSQVPLRRLLPRGADETQALAKLRHIQRRALANLEERGLDTLFLALGMASWPVADGGRATDAAVLLVPVAIEWKGRESRAASLSRTGDIQVNQVLLHALAVEQGCEVTEDALLGASELEVDWDEDAGWEPDLVYQRLQLAAQEVDGFAVRKRAVLGNFSFQKMAMVQDLRQFGEEMAAHDVIAALAGDPGAQRALREATAPIDPRELDRAPAADEYLVLDADHSQQVVVAGALQGQQMVVQGPPGTGKSQTIGNLITTLAARGKHILFVAEKRAALEVVLNRLKEVGLDHLALDLHGADISRRVILERLGQSLGRVQEAPKVDAEAVHRQFQHARQRLSDYVERLHQSRPPWGVSAYQIQARLLRSGRGTQSATRWRGSQLERLTGETATAVLELLREAAAYGGLMVGDHPSPWATATLRDGSAVLNTIDAVERLLNESWPAYEAALRDLEAAAKLPPASTVEDAHHLVDLVSRISATFQTYSAELFQADPDHLATVLAPAARGPAQRIWCYLTNPEYRRVKGLLQKLRIAGSASDPELLPELQHIARLSQEWRRRWPDAPLPTAPLAVDALLAAEQALNGDLEVIDKAFNGNLGERPFDQLLDFPQQLAEDTATAYQIPRVREIEAELQRLGASAFSQEIRRHKLEPDRWATCFEHAWLTSCLDHIKATDRAIAEFNGQLHSEFVEQFQVADRERAKLAAARVRRIHAENVVRVMNDHPDQEWLVKREIEKRRRHLPLRKLLGQAPAVLTALAPCWMASPLSVSQLLPGDRQYFDAIIFDEASQVLPQDAVPALLRARQAIVAGDEHQLPPTLFFVDGGEDSEAEEEVAPTAGMESLLQMLRASLGRSLPLRWHYRSRDEALIAFSNQEIYRPHGQELITFPGPGGEPAIEHILVDGPAARADQQESGSEEVRRVVELIIAHAERQVARGPDTAWETLGVIAMGIKHANRVQAAVDEALRSRPDLDEFFDTRRPERFFVKNLERVQGDERDIIILTIGYGKDSTGRLLYRFGPLNQEGGERRLNVAVTRARQRMILVSSFSHHDMDPARERAHGVRLLRRYLEYAASGGRAVGDSGQEEVALNFFEQDIFDALTQRGINLVPQWGTSRYRIDLVAQHPERPGQFVLAIECDGASYHSAPTARERDRLRQQQLEALGWRFHRIWSTDWFLRREEEIERAWQTYQEAVAVADARTTASEFPAGACSSEPLARQPAKRQRAGRPPVPRRSAIDHYTLGEIMWLVSWILSDGRLRTDEEIIDELVPEFGFKRRGRRIDAACRRAILETRLAEKQRGQTDGSSGERD